MRPTVSLSVFIQIIILIAVNDEAEAYFSRQEYGKSTLNHQCVPADPEFPFAITKLSGYRRILTITHGVIMVWIFIFLIPVSIFPVFWHRLAPNERVGSMQIKKWIWIHMLFTYPVYPLMATSLICAIIAGHDRRQVLKNSECSFYNSFHELLGIVCFLSYTFHFFLRFFRGEALQNEIYRSLRFYHSFCNFFAYIMSVPLISMARVSNKQGAKRYLYIVPYFYFILFQLYLNIRMKFADFGALEWHMITEAEVANENKGVILRTPQWIWNFGFPSKRRNGPRLIDLQVHSSVSRIRIQHYLDIYKFYWKWTLLVCFVVSGLMTAHLVLLYNGIYVSSANYFPHWHSLGDFYHNWSLLEDYAL